MGSRHAIEDESDCCHPYGGDPPCGGCPCCVEAQRQHYIYEYLRWRPIRLKVKFAILEMLSDGESHYIEYAISQRYSANYDYTRSVIKMLVSAGEIELSKRDPYCPEYRTTSKPD